MLKLNMKARTIMSYFFLLFIFVISMFVVAETGYQYIVPILILVSVATITAACYVLVNFVDPIEKIISTTFKMTKSMLGEDIELHSSDEIDKLAESINALAKKLEQNMIKISEERNRANAILNSMGDAVIAFDRNGCVLMLNPAVKNEFGIYTDKAVGKRVIEVIRSYELDNLLRRVIKKRRPINKEIKILLPAPKVFKVHATPLIGKKEDKIVGVVALMRDITERKRLENMRNEFVANVSHELRTPLTSLNGFLETLLDGAAEDSKITRRFLDIMKKETDRLTRLVDDLLKFSKLSDEKLVINKIEVNIADMVNQALQLFIPQADEKRIKMRSNAIKDLPEVKVDKDLIMQVFINLLDNAIKYTPSGGIIDINIDTFDEYIKISIADTGPGIPLNSINRIFERFYRVDKARTRDRGGTGLGLAIAKHAVELHGGKIWAENKGRGAVFSFMLPYK